MNTDLLPIGTIVRLTDEAHPERPYACVVPSPLEFADFNRVMFTRVLQDGEHLNSANGWFIDDRMYSFEVVPEDQVSDEIAILAGRCVFDPDFVPFVNEDNKIEGEDDA